MEFDAYGICCCALTELSELPYDVASDSEWEKENFEDEWKDFVRQLRELPGAALVAVNRKQLKAKKELEKRRFKVIGTVQSKEGNGTIWILARGLKFPRIKRGKHAKRS